MLRVSWALAHIQYRKPHISLFSDASIAHALWRVLLEIPLLGCQSYCLAYFHFYDEQAQIFPAFYLKKIELITYV